MAWPRVQAWRVQIPASHCVALGQVLALRGLGLLLLQCRVLPGLWWGQVSPHRPSPGPAVGLGSKPAAVPQASCLIWQAQGCQAHPEGMWNSDGVRGFPRVTQQVTCVQAPWRDRRSGSGLGGARQELSSPAEHGGGVGASAQEARRAGPREAPRPYLAGPGQGVGHAWRTEPLRVGPGGLWSSEQPVLIASTPRLGFEDRIGALWPSCWAGGVGSVPAPQGQGLRNASRCLQGWRLRVPTSRSEAGKL